MTAALQGWHPGEVAVQQKYGFSDAVSEHWRLTENFMREQHRIFHTLNLPFIPVTTVDGLGRPWGSIVAGATGEIGFVTSPDTKTLVVDTQLWPGDPLLDTIRRWINSKSRDGLALENFLTAGLGIEFPTRRRNKFAGRIRGVVPRSDLQFQLDLEIQEALGNCPKYINIRRFIPCQNRRPSIVFHRSNMEAGERLPPRVVELITDADTVFIASIYESESSTAKRYPSHAGMNARSGLPGFTRVRPSDGRTVVLPDYSGNRFLMSLGNVESAGLVGLTIVSFTTGEVLYLTGQAQVLVGDPAFKIMTRQPSITLMETTGFTLVRDALPVRQEPGTEVERSPYSPKVKYLCEEEAGLAGTSGGYKVQLVSALQYADDIATLRFKVLPKNGSTGLIIQPGQAIVLDFMDWIGPPVYRHMADGKPESLNDDRVRTWTVSSAHENQSTTWFELTMREMNNGAVTGRLFQLLRSKSRQGAAQALNSGIIAEVVGITGGFCVGQEPARMLWVAGGIGLTPFLAMFKALVDRKDGAEQTDVVLALASREPDIALKLLIRSLAGLPPNVHVQIDLFSSQEDKSSRDMEDIGVQVVTHKGRIQSGYWAGVADGRNALICGPGGFGDAAQAGLIDAGVPANRIRREGFY
ncbi:uncharacterized protein A1O9_12325 [Exophiala aquamarina CBS 119918]|uniref:Oxidoreductase FAD/NAD(P)-binding domain-containing protein n=1 Tax=Exophiala aquamarina CBS 119918 TaxID=1182545 RepID=A0A072P7V6_9EURO|nr:uncharacterized protein A1O9_12325 [Exophiala aquamarina CBS 119918]KEF51690.1 hypothetical protein A1O9_12325 [Exophiala aquamarina CBS 119918]